MARSPLLERGPERLLEDLKPLRWRVLARHLLEGIRLGVTLGLLGAAGLVVVARLRPVDAIWWWVTLVCGLAVLGSLLWAWWRRPDLHAVARAADGLGLEERVASALYATGRGHPAAPLLVADARRHLAKVDVVVYRLVPAPRRWRPVGLAALAVLVAGLAPVPAWSGGDPAPASTAALAQARAEVEEITVEVARARSPAELARAAEEELRGLERDLAAARDLAEAARAVEGAQSRLAGLVDAEDYAWRRAAENLATTWSGQADLREVARALSQEDAEAALRAMEELAARAGDLTAEEAAELRLALQQGANAARDVPALSGALREAAAQLGGRTAGGGEGTETGEGAARALAAAGSRVSEAAARAAALGAVRGAMRALSGTVAQLGEAAGSAVAGVAGRVAESSGQGAAGGESGGSGGSGAPGDGSGAPGEGAGIGTGRGDGAGQAGSGTGSGAGAGGGPAPGQPGAGEAGVTGGGGRGEPGEGRATAYDSVYAPSLLGGEGPEASAGGDPSGADGPTVELPESPVALGELRPYDQVFAEYESSARHALSRQPLPPALQGLVQRYFSSIAPEER